jgi:hypothetical protein
VLQPTIDMEPMWDFSTLGIEWKRFFLAFDILNDYIFMVYPEFSLFYPKILGDTLIITRLDCDIIHILL